MLLNFLQRYKKKHIYATVFIEILSPLYNECFLFIHNKYGFLVFFCKNANKFGHINKK
jgi:hypothetical protein